MDESLEKILNGDYGEDSDDEPEQDYDRSTANTLRQRDDVIMHGLLTFGVVSFDGLCV